LDYEEMIFYYVIRKFDIFLSNLYYIAAGIKFKLEKNDQRILNIFEILQSHKMVYATKVLLWIFRSKIPLNNGKSSNIYSFLIANDLYLRPAIDLDKNASRDALGKFWERIKMKNHTYLNLLEMNISSGAFKEVTQSDYNSLSVKSDSWKTKLPIILATDLLRNKFGRNEKVITSHNFGVVHIKDATAVNGSNAFLAQGGILLDEYRSCYPQDCDPKNEPFLLGVKGNMALVDNRFLGQLATKRLESGYWMAGPMFNEWGHFLNTYLPKLVELVENNLPSKIPIIIPQGSSKKLVDIITKVINKHEVIFASKSEKYLIRNLYYFPSTVFSPTNIRAYDVRYQSNVYVDPGQFKKFYNLLNDKYPKAISYNSEKRNILWLRRGLQRRQLLNQAEFEKVVLENGFLDFDPLEHSVEEQLHIIRSADYLCGEIGSWIYMVGINPNVKVTLVISDWDQHWWNEVGSLNQILNNRIKLVIGKRVSRKDYRSENGPSASYTISQKSLMKLKIELSRELAISLVDGAIP
jgi:hypothetical protein